MWKAVRPDVSSSDSGHESYGSQENREGGSWEFSSGKEEKMEEEEAEHEQQEPKVSQDGPEVQDVLFYLGICSVENIGFMCYFLFY